MGEKNADRERQIFSNPICDPHFGIGSRGFGGSLLKSSGATFSRQIPNPWVVLCSRTLERSKLDYPGAFKEAGFPGKFSFDRSSVRDKSATQRSGMRRLNLAPLSAARLFPTFRPLVARIFQYRNLLSLGKEVEGAAAGRPKSYLWPPDNLEEGSQLADIRLRRQKILTKQRRPERVISAAIFYA